MTAYSLTIIIPTFNSRDNIENIIAAVSDVLKKSGIKGEIIVVDDNSKDGTADCVRKLCEKHSELSLIARSEDHGLSQSLHLGIYAANSDLIQVINADFSHPVELIPQFYHAMKDEGCDVCIGSRYTKDGDIHKWSPKRRILSLGKTVFGRVLFPEITDPVSGFFAIKKDVVCDVPLKPQCYKILIEILGRGRWNSFKEIPYSFKEQNESGSIKLKLRGSFEYIKQCISIGLYAFGHRETYVWKEWKKVFKFGLVGISGIFVNTGLLYVLTEYFGLYYVISSVFAIEASIVTNFILNDFWTFKRGEKSRIASKFKRFVSYQAVSVIGVFINVLILYLFTEYLNLWYINSNIIGIFVVFIWNFFVNRNLTWRMG
ncbi:MAG: glycosyltransferase family 2 protein [Methanomicrobiaceae archaeon]|nr:glycosyltransferase family 2 protein [Methanomicrobiaceae archaeon]